MKTKIEKQIHKLCRKLEEDKNKVTDLIIEYLDSCNMKLEDGYTNYYDEDVPLKEIQGSRGLILTTEGDEIDYRDMDFEELVDLYNVVSSYNK